MSPTASTASAPSPSSALDSRVLSLDALRGVAIIGIAAMNVLVFAMPAAAYVNPRAWGGTGPVETALWALVFLVIEDKFRNLFAMLFGAGVAILLARAKTRPLAGHFARMAVLFAIGFAHATLLANNDILRLYAVTGLILPLFVRFEARTLLGIAAVLVVGQLLISGWYAWPWLEYWWGWHSGAISEAGPLVRAERAFGADPATLSAALERGRETFSRTARPALFQPGGAIVHRYRRAAVHSRRDARGHRLVAQRPARGDLATRADAAPRRVERARLAPGADPACAGRYLERVCGRHHRGQCAGLVGAVRSAARGRLGCARDGAVHPPRRQRRRAAPGRDRADGAH